MKSADAIFERTELLINGCYFAQSLFRAELLSKDLNMFYMHKNVYTVFSSSQRNEMCWGRVQPAQILFVSILSTCNSCFGSNLRDLAWWECALKKLYFIGISAADTVIDQADANLTKMEKQSRPHWTPPPPNVNIWVAITLAFSLGGIQ